MENADCGSPSLQKEEKSGSEESCCECCCEACRSADSPEDSTDRLQLPFTKLKEVTREVLSPPVVQECLPPESAPMLQSLSPAHPAENLTVAIEDLHVRQARLKAKKQRRCAFCRIHGFPVSVKGHKAFCQFREKCTCKGCTLIRCNQQVSKNQIRLRRQKDMEVDPEGLSAGMGEQHSFIVHDSSKKNPMCFKCWVHDSIRVRLKGHRNICPYARCACCNCALSTDRKWLNRQLRELAAPPKDKGADCPRVGSYWGDFAGIHTPSVSQSAAVQQTVSANAVLSSTSTLTSSQSNHGELGVFPVKLHKAGEWQLNPMLSFPAPGIKQETDYLQNVLIGVSSNPTRSGPVFQDASCVLPDIKWLPYSNSQFTLPSSLGPVSRTQGDISHITAINNSNYNTSGATSSPSRPAESSGLYKWYPQHAPSFKASDAGPMAMHSDAVSYPQSSTFLLPSQYCQYPVQAQSKVESQSQV